MKIFSFAMTIVCLLYWTGGAIAWGFFGWHPIDGLSGACSHSTKVSDFWRPVRSLPLVEGVLVNAEDVSLRPLQPPLKPEAPSFRTE
jgi:hypothetical protein